MDPPSLRRSGVDMLTLLVVDIFRVKLDGPAALLEEPFRKGWESFPDGLLPEYPSDPNPNDPRGLGFEAADSLYIDPVGEKRGAAGGREAPFAGVERVVMVDLSSTHAPEITFHVSRAYVLLQVLECQLNLLGVSHRTWMTLYCHVMSRAPNRRGHPRT